MNTGSTTMTMSSMRSRRLEKTVEIRKLSETLPVTVGCSVAPNCTNLYKYKVHCELKKSNVDKWREVQGSAGMRKVQRQRLLQKSTALTALTALIQVRLIGSFIPRAKSGLCLGVTHFGSFLWHVCHCIALMVACPSGIIANAHHGSKRNLERERERTDEMNHNESKLTKSFA